MLNPVNHTRRRRRRALQGRAVRRRRRRLRPPRTRRPRRLDLVHGLRGLDVPRAGSRASSGLRRRGSTFEIELWIDWRRDEREERPWRGSPPRRHDPATALRSQRAVRLALPGETSAAVTCPACVGCCRTTCGVTARPLTTPRMTPRTVDRGRCAGPRPRRSPAPPRTRRACGPSTGASAVPPAGAVRSARAQRGARHAATRVPESLTCGEADAVVSGHDIPPSATRGGKELRIDALELGFFRGGGTQAGSPRLPGLPAA